MRFRAVAATAAAITLIAATPSTIDTLNVTLAGSNVQISGTATWGSQDRVLVGQDAGGDALGGPAATAAGLDVTTLEIRRPSGAAATLEFTLGLDGMATDGIPEGVQYNWDIEVFNPSGVSTGRWSLKTMRSQAATQQNTDPWAAISTCVPNPQTNGFTCSTLQTIPVVYDGAADEIRMSVPMGAIGAVGGGRIDAWYRGTSPIWVGPSAGGQLSLSNLFDTATHDSYAVPGGTVAIGVAPAGTDPASVSFPTSATVSGKNFSATVAAPGPGSYDVHARACFAGQCTVSSRTLEVPTS